jgi:hypothetical protein
MPPDPIIVPGGDPPIVGDDPKSPTVSREHHERVLSEKKKAATELAAANAKLAARDAADAAAEEARLLANGEAKKALDTKAAELATANAKLAAHEETARSAKKLDSFFAAVGGKVERKFWGLIDFDQITIDEAGQVDEGSVAKYVETFKKTYPETIAKQGQGNGMPNDKPQGSGGSLTLDEWKKLPLKDRQKRIGEVKLAQK